VYVTIPVRHPGYNAAMGEYDVLFNILFEPFRGWWLMIFALVGAVLAGGCWALDASKHAKAFITAVGVVFGLGGVVATWLSWSEYTELRETFRSGQALEIEGRASHTAGRFDEIVVGHARFRMGPMQTAAYNRPVRRGGANLTSRCVRIFYTPNSRFSGDNAILWIAMKRTNC
jgi:hypothetical protein